MLSKLLTVLLIIMCMYVAYENYLEGDWGIVIFFSCLTILESYRFYKRFIKTDSRED
nr:hypothetical protein [Macrococcus goetzii]